MKLSRKAAIRAIVLVAAGGAVLGISQAAFAATPPYEPDAADQIGQLLFYNASGALVTSGSISDDNNFQYAVATADDPITTNTVGTLYAFTPVNGQPPGNWTGEPLTGSRTFPVVSPPAPANVAAAGAHRPVVTMRTTAQGDNNLAGYIADVPNADTTTAYKGLYQIRLLTAGNTKYWAADILVDSTTHQWSLQYPNNTFATSTTTLAASPASPQNAPASAITLTATVTNNDTGTVVFTDTDTNAQVGTTQTLPGSGGGANQASVTIPTGLGAGTHHYTATYLPTAGTFISGSNGSTTYVVNGRPTAVSLTVTPNTNLHVGDQITLDSTASFTSGTGTPVGSITWKDGTTTLAGPTGVDAAGHAAAGPATFGLTTGPHSIVAFFQPTDPNVSTSQSAPVAFTINPATDNPCSNVATGTPPTSPYPNDPRTDICHDQQSFDVTVPNGNLFVSTPYDGSDAAHTFHLGTMKVTPDGKNLHTSNAFGVATQTSPGSQGVTIIDTRSGGAGWTATVASTDFTSGANLISACNLGFTGVTPDYVTGNALSPSHPIAVTDVPNGSATNVAPATAGCTATGLAGTGHTFASIATLGAGSVNVFGNMDLYAPTSTPAGLYQATVTFTIF
jgi:hypothetical protein